MRIVDAVDLLLEWLRHRVLDHLLGGPQELAGRAATRHRLLSCSRAAPRRRSRSLRSLVCGKRCLAAGFPVAQSGLELPQARPGPEKVYDQMARRLSLAELEQRIAIARDNIRQLPPPPPPPPRRDEDRNADRIAQQQEKPRPAGQAARPAAEKITDRPRAPAPSFRWRRCCCLHLRSRHRLPPPSCWFDCRTARTARELATCADARIAAADRELAAAWQNAIAPLDPATVKALREPIRRSSSKISTAASRARSGASRVRRREKSCARRSRACAAAAVRGWYSRPPRQLRS